MPRVTIVVPAYNAEEHIIQCLDSVVTQTLDDIEVLLINDGSTDSTGDIFDEYARRYSFVRVVHQENSGIFVTRSVALSLATGEYVGWVDADDWVAPTMFETLYKAAVTNESDLVYCNYSYFPKGVRSKTKWYKEYHGVKNVSYVERNSQFWNKLISRELLLREEIHELLPMCFEEAMIFVLLAARNPISIDSELYQYRVGHSSMSANYRNVAYYCGFIDAAQRLYTIATDRCLDQYWCDYFYFRKIYYCLMALIVAANAGERNEFRALKDKMKNEMPRYRKNQHFLKLLKEIYGCPIALVIGYVVPFKYSLTRMMCKIAFR